MKTETNIAPKDAEAAAMRRIVQSMHDKCAAHAEAGNLLLPESIMGMTSAALASDAGKLLLEELAKANEAAGDYQAELRRYQKSAEKDAARIQQLEAHIERLKNDLAA